MKKAGKTGQGSDTLPEELRIIQTLLDNLPGMAYRSEYDLSRKMTFVSSGCESITGHNKDYLLDAQLGWSDFICVDDRDEVSRAVSAALAAGQRFDIQYRVIDKFGQEKWVREQGCGIYADDGRAVAIEGYIDDITSLRNTTLKLAKSEAYYEEAMRQGYERLAVTIDNAPIGIVSYRIGEPFLSANRAFCEMTGYSADELRRISMLELTHPDDRNDSKAFVEMIRRREIDSYSQQKRYLCKDGSVIHVSIVDAVTHDADGQPNLIIGQVADLTEQIQAQSEIRRQHERLAHADRLNTLGEMATGIAHEINQPLTAISLFAQTGKRLFESEDYSRLPEIFDKLSQHSHRAGAIVERMQDMARRSERSRQIIDLNTLIADVVDFAEVDARTNDVVIEVRSDPGLPAVEIDAVQIQQVVLNLLRNGIDAMRSINCRNGNTIQLCTRHRNDGFLEVIATDSGGGVSDAVADKIFDTFSTTKNTGLGMGLPISKAIVEEHGGQIAFHNNDVNGATFSFTLPPAEKGNQEGQ